MRKLLYMTVAVVTFTISAIVQLILIGNPYRFQYTALTGDLATVDAMLAQGVPVDMKDNFGETALMVAAQDGHIDTVNLLLARGANANVHRQGDGFTALGLAKSMHKTLVAQKLREAGAAE